MLSSLSLLRPFKGRKIGPAPSMPAAALDQVGCTLLKAKQFATQTLNSAQGALQPALSTLYATVTPWGWQQSFVLVLCLLYIVFTVVTVVRARRLHRCRLRDVRNLSLEQLKLELEALLDEGRAEGHRLATRNKFSVTGTENDLIDMDAEGEGYNQDWHWRDIRDRVLRQRLY